MTAEAKALPAKSTTAVVAGSLMALVGTAFVVVLSYVNLVMCHVSLPLHIAFALPPCAVFIAFALWGVSMVLRGVRPGQPRGSALLVAAIVELVIVCVSASLGHEEAPPTCGGDLPVTTTTTEIEPAPSAPTKNAPSAMAPAASP